MKEKVILAYSGGLDTTAIIPWLKENYDYEVICVCIDVWRSVQNLVVHPNYILRMLSMSFVMTMSFLVFRQMLFMRTNIY